MKVEDLLVVLIFFVKMVKDMMDYVRRLEFMGGEIFFFIIILLDNMDMSIGIVEVNGEVCDIKIIVIVCVLYCYYVLGVGLVWYLVIKLFSIIYFDRLLFVLFIC